ncbi:MAG: hypothetical protein ACI9KN_000411 [Gammaproteobacteria bacterium]|jgi:hypothetical protein
MFDLEDDPKERHNLYFNADLEAIRQELSQLLHDEFPPQTSVENKTLAKW